MGLENVDDILDHCGFPTLFFGEGIVSEIFINPDSAVSLLVDGNHGFGNLKSAKPVEQSLKTYEALLDKV